MNLLHCCCDSGEPCIPKFMRLVVPRCGFSALKGQSRSRFANKNITYSTDSGLSYSVAITVTQRAGVTNWSETSNLTPQQRADMLAQVRAGLAAFTYSGDELLSASGSGVSGYTYNWSISVSNLYDVEEDFADLAGLNVIARATGFAAQPENTYYGFGYLSHGNEGLDGVVDVALLGSRTVELSTVPEVLFTQSPVQWFSAVGLWWQTQLTGFPGTTEIPFLGIGYKPELMVCNYTNEHAFFGEMSLASPGSINRMIMLLGDSQRTPSICGRFLMNTGEYECVVTSDGILEAPMPEFTGINSYRYASSSTAYMTSPGYSLTESGVCSCTSAP